MLAHGAQIIEVHSPGKDLPKLKPMYDHLVDKGWLDKAIAYTNSDEATDSTYETENIPYYSEMKKLYPKLRVFAATEWHEGLDKGCDIWLNDLSTGQDMDSSCRGKGKASLWNYYCGLPINCDFFASGDDQPQMGMVERRGVEHRLPLWIAWKYDVKGIFIFGGNLCAPKSIAADGSLWEENRPSKWPYSGNLNGDGFLLYPPCTPSIRMKIIRDGLEDYGYLMELRKMLPLVKDPVLKKTAEDLLAIPAQVMVNTHYFNRDPASILAAREKIGDLIDSTTGKTE